MWPPESRPVHHRNVISNDLRSEPTDRTEKDWPSTGCNLRKVAVDISAMEATDKLDFIPFDNETDSKITHADPEVVCAAAHLLDIVDGIEVMSDFFYYFSNLRQY